MPKFILEISNETEFTSNNVLVISNLSDDIPEDEEVITQLYDTSNIFNYFKENIEEIEGVTLMLESINDLTPEVANNLAKIISYHSRESGLQNIKDFYLIVSPEDDAMPEDDLIESLSIITNAVIHQNSNIQSFGFSYNLEDSDAAQEIVKVIEHSKQISKLYLDSNQINADTLKLLLQALQHNHSITDLILSHNPKMLTLDGIEAIATYFEAPHSVNNINLQYCKIDSAKATMIVDAMQYANTPINLLDLSQNDINSGIISTMVEMLYSNKIKCLDLSYNNINIATYAEMIKDNPIIQMDDDISLNYQGLQKCQDASDRIEFAISHLNQEQTKSFLELFPLDINATNKDGLSLLDHWAHKPNITQFLIEKGSIPSNILDNKIDLNLYNAPDPHMLSNANNEDEAKSGIEVIFSNDDTESTTALECDINEANILDFNELSF